MSLLTPEQKVPSNKVSDIIDVLITFARRCCLHLHANKGKTDFVDIKTTP